MNGSGVRLVLFDLDGTLVDTAPDLAAAVNRQRVERGLAALPLAQLRSQASHGARGLIGRAFGIAPGAPEYETLRVQFMQYYESALCVHSRLFGGMDDTLTALESRGLAWGIVTNKIARFTDPLVRALNLHQRAACVVSGDATPHTKPHPAPLEFALRACRSQASAAIYVGDDRRDVDAGRAAGMRTVIAEYGYLGDAPELDGWGADHRIAAPADLLAWLGD